jgi:uncharacterized protein
VTRAPVGGPLVHNIAGLLGEPYGTSRSFELSGVVLDLGPDLRQSEPLAGTVHVDRTNRGVIVTGRLVTALATQCSRCLRDIDVPLVLTLKEEVLPTIDIATGLALDASAEPDIARLTDHHELDLEPLVRESIQLAEPIAPLCREDCPGLCVVCGEELASGVHEHDDARIDPRLEALRRFRVDGGPESE